MLLIQRLVLEQMVEHCVRSVPHEACGALLGHRAEDGGGQPPVIISAVAVTNRAERPEHSFRFDEREWLALLYEIERYGLHLAGIYHSHPDSPPFPSAKDRGSVWSGLPSYWIISLAGDAPKIEVYRLLPEKDRHSGTLTAVAYSIL
jgi:proteasome lid subunit RPN8/RPN11